MKFREKKLRTHDATPAVQSSESQESPTRERERRLTFADKDARLFSASQRSSYARVCMYACAHAVTSTHTRRFIAGATSRFHDLHVSFLARIAMRGALSSSPAPDSSVHHTLFFLLFFFIFAFDTAFGRAVQRTSITCEENNLGPTRPLAEPRGSAIGDWPVDEKTMDEAEPSRAEPS